MTDGKVDAVGINLRRKAKWALSAFRVVLRGSDHGDEALDSAPTATPAVGILRNIPVWQASPILPTRPFEIERSRRPGSSRTQAGLWKRAMSPWFTA